MLYKTIDKVLTHLENGIKFKKCWKCGCQQGAIKALENQLQNLKSEDKELIEPLLRKSEETFEAVQYDCLGCKVCFPALAVNALVEAYPEIELESNGCASDDIIVEERLGWPPLPGKYKVNRFEAPIAICTLNSNDLMEEVINAQHSQVSIVGSMNTENLGIERLIKNVTTNPNIRFLILCGEDSKQVIGHLPGQSLVSLFENGIDPQKKRIIGAKGKRPILKNISLESIEHIKRQVRLVNMIGCSDLADITETIDECASEKIIPFEGGFNMNVNIEKIQAKMPPPLRLDPCGYFVIFPDQDKNIIAVEHYHNNGALNKIVEGEDISAIYMTIIENKLISKLDHACYLGKELARAEESLRTRTPYVQDKAQDSQKEVGKQSSCCDSNNCC
ncbi:MAG: DUF4346 domain-containing protein [Thermodesulfobacteriota bacterium]